MADIVLGFGVPLVTGARLSCGLQATSSHWGSLTGWYHGACGMFLPPTFWYQLTQIVLDKELLSDCCCILTEQRQNWFQILLPPTTILRPLYRTTFLSQHPLLRNGGFCWCKVLLPARPCWHQQVHSDWGEDAIEFFSKVLPAPSPYHQTDSK